MAGRNIVRFYVNKDSYIGSKQKLDEIVAKLNTSLEIYSEDGIDYYTFQVSRPNHFSMSNGTAMKIDLDNPTVPVDEYVHWIEDLVDNIV
jgi:hypothetical protein